MRLPGWTGSERGDLSPKQKDRLSRLTSPRQPSRCSGVRALIGQVPALLTIGPFADNGEMRGCSAGDGRAISDLNCSALLRNIAH